MLIEDELRGLASRAYYAYAAVTDHKNYLGNPMPDFSDLPEKIRDAWRAAVRQVIRDLEPDVDA